MERKSVEDLRMEVEIKSKIISIIEEMEHRTEWYLYEDENGNKLPPKKDLNNYDYIYYVACQKASEILRDAIS